MLIALLSETISTFSLLLTHAITHTVTQLHSHTDTHIHYTAYFTHYTTYHISRTNFLPDRKETLVKTSAQNKRSSEKVVKNSKEGTVSKMM